MYSEWVVVVIAIDAQCVHKNIQLLLLEHLGAQRCIVDIGIWKVHRHMSRHVSWGYWVGSQPSDGGFCDD